MTYTLFVPTTYDPKKLAPLVVNLHGYDITPLQQMLFDGTTRFRRVLRIHRGSADGL